MSVKKQYGILDYTKMAAAILVIAIHTSPLASYQAEADFLLTRVIARMAVPFFIMVTGFFLLPEYALKNRIERKKVSYFIKKTFLLYFVSVLCYLPLGIYAGHYDNLIPLTALRMLTVDGTFYHLWYLPAVITGVLFLSVLGRKLPYKVLAVIAVLFYTVGLFGDSYYGFIESVPPVKSAYDFLFQISSYTRNGIFYVPLFLIMGAGCAGRKETQKPGLEWAGVAVSLSLLIAEAFLLRNFSMQRHDSMYFMLVPCMYFLFRLLLRVPVRPLPGLRPVSTAIYLLHPFVIVLVRGGAKVTGTESVFVDNSLMHFMAVCTASVIAAAAAAKGYQADRERQWNRKSAGDKGRAWTELNRAALRSNIEVLRSALPCGCKLMPAVKADAYGHGAVLVARECRRMGVDAYCVASVQEGVQLRKHYIKGTILILGYTHSEQFPLLRRYRLTQTVVDFAAAERLNRFGHKLKVQIAIDTGMHRLGLSSQNTGEILSVFQMKHLRVEGIYTHFCASDSEDEVSRNYTLSQARAMQELVQSLRELGQSVPKVHALSSYGLLHYPEYAWDYVRAGIALYGVLSTKEDTQHCTLPLRPVLSVKARVASVRDLLQGETAGYGMQFKADRDSRIAAIAIGYADGLPRVLSDGVGKVLIRGCEAPVIGRVCMDQTLIDVTDIPCVEEGDVAVIIGSCGSLRITACDLAGQAGTISNEILSRLGTRLKRHFT